MKIKCIGTAILLMAASISQGELLVEEHFDYPAGSLKDSSLWATFGSAGPNSVKLEEGSLSFAGLPDSIGRHALVSQDGGERVSYPVLPSITEGTVYYSAVVKLTELPTASTYAMHFTGSRYCARVFFKAEGEEFRVGVANSTRAPYSKETFKVGESLLLVVKYTFGATEKQDEISLFINPDASSKEPETPAVTLLDRPETLINEFILRQWDGVGSYAIDELRIGTTWDAAMGREKLSARVAAARREYLKWSPDHSNFRLKWNNPGLIDDMGVGLWANPLPMDWDHDGDMDMIMISRAKPNNGTFFFENDGSGVFLPPVEIGPPVSNATISYTEDGPVVLSPGKIYRDFSSGIFGKAEKIDFKPDFYAGRANQWQLVDYDGNGVHDLMIGISDWRDYGWDDAYNEKGEWTAGPLHGYVYIVMNKGTDDEPDYAEPFQVKAGGKDLDVFGAPSPNYVDWDGDGDLDILCGSFLDRLTFFENTGTRTNPTFADGKFLEVDGETVHIELQMLQMAAPDWDGDGDPDLIVGQEDGRILFVENVGKGKIAAPVFLKQRGDDMKFGALSTPWPTDWDGDGDDDLIIGNTAGFLAFVENLDGGNPPKFAEPELLKADGETIRFLAGENLSIQGPAEAKWGYTAPTVADWNNDGLPDIIVNSIIGSIVWFKNVGTRTEPKLTGPLPIEINGEGTTPAPAWNWWKPKGRELVTQWRTTPVTMDLNEDGKMDLILQDPEGFMAYYERVGDPSSSSLVSLPDHRFHLKEAFGLDNHIGDTQEYDFNEDGINDLLQRGEDGEVVYLYLSPIDRKPMTKTRTEAITKETKLFAPPEAESSLLRTNVGWAGRAGRRKFCVADWDADGDLDILINSRGIDFLENVGEDGEFAFINRGRIIPHILAGHTTWPVVVDWNKDGILDLLVGAEDGNFYYYQRTTPQDLTKGLD